MIAIDHILIGAYLVFMGIMAGLFWRTTSHGRRWFTARAAEGKRFCRECRWAVPDTTHRDDDMSWRYAHCMHVSSRARPENYLVTGTDHVNDMLACSTARDSNSLGSRCGMKGRYWEPGPQISGPAPREAISRPPSSFAEEMQAQRSEFRARCEEAIKRISLCRAVVNWARS